MMIICSLRNLSERVGSGYHEPSCIGVQLSSSGLMSYLTAENREVRMDDQESERRAAGRQERLIHTDFERDLSGAEGFSYEMTLRHVEHMRQRKKRSVRLDGRIWLQTAICRNFDSTHKNMQLRMTAKPCRYTSFAGLRISVFTYNDMKDLPCK